MADETKLTAATRIEKLLDNIAGGDNEVTPATRLEKFLSYIADAMEGGGGSGGGGCENCVKVLNGATVDRLDHLDAPIYAYTESHGWTNIINYPISMLFNTEDDIPDAYVTNEPVTGVTFPIFIVPITDFVAGETHVPTASNNSGYYIEYADAYSLFTQSEFSTLVLKNGVVKYHEGGLS